MNCIISWQQTKLFNQRITISENRTYHYLCEVTLEKSKVLNSPDEPKDDKVNWMFLKVGQSKFSFIYKFEAPLKSSYKKPFNIYLSFLMDDVVKELLQLNFSYELLRGEEIIGRIRILKLL